MQRLAAAVGSAPLLIAAQAGAARASSTAQPTRGASAASGSAPSALSWIPIADTRGISIWKYEMSLDRGGVTSPSKVIWSFLIDLFWQVYRAVVAIAIWIIDWVLSFAWLQTIAGPLLSLSSGLADVVDQLGLVPVLLTTMALCAVLWMARGKWALGIFELFTSLLIASVAVGVLADPVGLVAGPDGMLIQSRDLGLEVADGLANDGGTGGSAAELRADVTAMLADAFVRQPAQLLNFGSLIDGGPCEGTYDEVVAAGPYGTESDIRDAVGECDEALGEAAANPNAGMATSAVVLAPAALIVLAFAILLAGVVLLAGMYALYQSVKAIVTLVVGLLPGRARGSLWRTVADLVMALVTVVFSIVFLTAYLLLIQGVFESAEPGDDVMQTFIAVDIMLVVGLIVFWRGRNSLQRASERLAQALSTRPGATPTALPARDRLNATDVYYKAKMGIAGVGAARGAAAAVGERAGAGRDALYRGAGTVGHAAGRAVSDTRSRFGLAAAGAAATSAGSPLAGPPSDRAGAAAASAGSRVTDRVRASRTGSGSGRIARIGAVTAVTAITGGAAAVGAQAGRRAVTGTARRAAITARVTKALPPGRPAGPRRPAPRSPAGSPGRAGYDRVVRDGQVLLVPRYTGSGSTAGDPPGSRSSGPGGQGPAAPPGHRSAPDQDRAQPNPPGVRSTEGGGASRLGAVSSAPAQRPASRHAKPAATARADAPTERHQRQLEPRRHQRLEPRPTEPAAGEE